MRPKIKLFEFFCLTLVFFFSCQKDKDTFDNLTLQNGAKIKRILLYSSIDSKDPISIVEEYEYDEDDRICKVSTPMYQDGKIVGTTRYDLYEYDSQGQLAKIKNYNANINSPTGFINLKNFIYTYSNEKKEKEVVEYPQIGSFEYSLFKYEGDKIKRIEKYDNSGSLEIYILNDYDKSGNLIKETSFGKDNQPIFYTQHTYKNGVNVQSDVFAGKDLKEYVRQILRTYDENKNLTILESNELSLYSSMMSHVLKYEYIEK
jgi:hypothetical protein